MLNVKTQIIIAILVAAGFIYIIMLIKKKRLQIRHSLIWFFTGAAILIFDLFPGLMAKLSGFLGIYAPVNMLFFLGFLFSIIIIFYLTITVSKQSSQIRNLTQELGILKKKMQDSDEDGDADA